MTENQVKSFNSKNIFEIEWQKAIGLQSSLFCDKNHEQIRQKNFVVVNMLLMKHQKLEKKKTIFCCCCCVVNNTKEKWWKVIIIFVVQFPCSVFYVCVCWVELSTGGFN